jgi:hypothetical protein
MYLLFFLTKTRDEKRKMTFYYYIDAKTNFLSFFLNICVWFNTIFYIYNSVYIYIYIYEQTFVEIFDSIKIFSLFYITFLK